MGNGPSLGNSLLFPAPHSSYDESLKQLIWIPEDFGFTKRRWEHKSFPALWLKAAKPTKCLIIYFHANSCDIGHIQPELQVIGDYLNASICAVEFPGYGIPPDKIYPQEYPNGDDINRRGISAFNMFVHLGVPPSSIVFFGRSIGTGPACRIAGDLSKRGVKIGGVVLHAPYMSVHKIVQDYSPLGTWIIDNYWDNEASLADMAPNTPLLIIHGLDDEIINTVHGKTLFENYKSDLKIGFFPSESYHNEFYVIDDIAIPFSDFLMTKSHVKENKTFDIDVPEAYKHKPHIFKPSDSLRTPYRDVSISAMRSVSLPPFGEVGVIDSQRGQISSRAESARVAGANIESARQSSSQVSSPRGIFRRTVSRLSQRKNSRSSSSIVDEKPLSNYLDQLTQQGAISREFVNELVGHVHETVDTYSEDNCQNTFTENTSNDAK